MAIRFNWAKIWAFIQKAIAVIGIIKEKSNDQSQGLSETKKVELGPISNPKGPGGVS